jgi:hypothetical protein
MSETQNIFAPPAIPTASPSTHTYIQPDLNYALRVWWAFYWPTNLISGILSFLLSAAVMRIYQNTAFPAKILKPILTIGPYVLTYTIAIFVMRYILGKTFRHFRIALLSTDLHNPQPLPATFSRAIRVWWTFSWRTLIYSLLGYAVVIMPVGLFVGLFTTQPAILGLLGMLIGLLVNAAASLFVLYSNILDEEIADFRVTLLPRNPVPAPTEIPFS